MAKPDRELDDLTDYGAIVDSETGFAPERLVPHHNADGSLKHYCTAEYCPDIHGVKH